MAAPNTYAIRRAQRRRRAVLGVSSAIVLATALGVGFAGAADPSLKNRIDSARTDAGQLSNRVEALSERTASLEEQAHQAGARAMELNAEVQRAEARSQELANQLDAAQQKLDELRSEYAEAVKQLDQRLIAIYETDAPSAASVVLSSDGFDDLSTRSDYLKALHDADLHVAHRVETLRNQMAGRTHQIADLKQQVDQEAQQLSAARASFVASEQASDRSAAAVA